MYIFEYIWIFCRIPRDPERRLRWCQAARLNVNDLGITSYLCSKHFEKDSFSIGQGVKKTVVPTRFPWNDPSLFVSVSGAHKSL